MLWPAKQLCRQQMCLLAAARHRWGRVLTINMQVFGLQQLAGNKVPLSRSLSVVQSTVNIMCFSRQMPKLEDHQHCKHILLNTWRFCTPGQPGITLGFSIKLMPKGVVFICYSPQIVHRLTFVADQTDTLA